MPTPSRPDPEQLRIPEDAWEFVEITDDFIRHRAPLERRPDGSVLYCYRTAPRAIDTLIAHNQHMLDESQHKRFGDGRSVARIPLNVLYDPRNQLAAKLKEGDSEHLKWWLDRDEARPWRRFRGRLT